MANGKQYGIACYFSGFADAYAFYLIGRKRLFAICSGNYKKIVFLLQGNSVGVEDEVHDIGDFSVEPIS